MSASMGYVMNVTVSKVQTTYDAAHEVMLRTTSTFVPDRPVTQPLDEPKRAAGKAEEVVQL
jgi:hypothetical protein